MSEVNFSLDNFLDQEVSALPDRPTRPVLPAGTHVVAITNVERKEVGEEKKPVLTIKAKFIETLALANPADTPLEANTEIEFGFGGASQAGLASLKEFLMPLAQPGMKTGDLLQAIPGNQFKVTTKTRKYKTKSGEDAYSHDAVGGLTAL